MRSSSEQYLNSSGLVDKKIGELYLLLETIQTNLTEIRHISHHLPQLHEIYTNITDLLRLSTEDEALNFTNDNIGALSDYFNNLNTLITNRVSLDALADEIEDNAELAQAWSSAAEDTEVITGLFSALHYAAKASQTNQDIIQLRSDTEAAVTLLVTAAETAETNAAASASSADSSATDSAASASNASTSESNAANSANASAVSETNSSTSETNAATSATAAQLSETNAASAESNVNTLKNAVDAKVDELTGLLPVIGSFTGNTTDSTETTLNYSGGGSAISFSNNTCTILDVSGASVIDDGTKMIAFSGKFMITKDDSGILKINSGTGDTAIPALINNLTSASATPTEADTVPVTPIPAYSMVLSIVGNDLVVKVTGEDNENVSWSVYVSGPQAG